MALDRDIIGGQHLFEKLRGTAPLARRSEDIRETHPHITLWTPCDPLGLLGKPSLERAVCDAIDFHGLTNGLELPGSHPANASVERMIANWQGKESARLLTANGTTLHVKHSDTVLIAADHTSAMRTTFEWADVCTVRDNPPRTHTNTPESIAAALSSLPHQTRKIIAVESIRSSDGRVADLRKICAIALRHQAILVVDETNALGAYGSTGAGIAQALECTNQIGAIVARLERTIGLPAIFIAADSALLEVPANHCGTRQTATLPAYLAEGAEAAIRLIQTDTAGRKTLWKTTEQLRAALDYIGLPVEEAGSHILSIPVRSHRQAALAQSLLLDHYKIFVDLWAPPFAPPDHAHLLLMVTSRHTLDQVEAATVALETLAAEMGWSKASDMNGE